jgi:hypothetical protein
MSCHHLSELVSQELIDIISKTKGNPGVISIIVVPQVRQTPSSPRQSG